MTSATLLTPPVVPAGGDARGLICAACFGDLGGPSGTGLYCAHCACHRCGEDATGGGGAHDGYCAACAAQLEVELPGFFG